MGQETGQENGTGVGDEGGGGSFWEIPESSV